MRQNRTKIVALAVFVFMVIGLTAGPAAKKNIAVSLNKKEIRDLDGSGLLLVFFIQVTNASSSDYALSKYDYRVVVQETDYFSLKTSLEEPILVPKSGDTLISFPVKITYSLLFEAVPSVEQSARVPCYITGLLIFVDSRRREEKVPFAFSAEFPIYKDPDVAVQPIELKTLTIGGTEFAFSFSCRNANGFEIVLGDIAYDLELEGHPISKGVIRGQNNLEAQGERAFRLPFVLDFFELGKEYFGIFDRPSAEFRLKGEANASSVWGDLKIVFSRRGSAPIVRQ
jgi:LEA14-like dessication related protein